MVRSNWQGAIWRGAMLALLFGAGLAWTQTPGPGSVADPADKIMVVHENGRSTRCRVMETWQLPDGRVAQLLQALDTGEMITIVDEPGSNPDIKNARAMPKRIFAWGQGRRAAPEGSPVPPHMQIASGMVIKDEAPPPSDAIPDPGPVIVNRDVPPAMIVPESSTGRNRPGFISRLFGKKDVVVEKTSDPQVVEFRNPPPGLVVATMPNSPQTTPTLPEIPQPTLPYVGDPTRVVEMPGQGIQRIVSQPAEVTANVGPAPMPGQPIVSEPIRNGIGAASDVPMGPVACDPSKPESCKPGEAAVKRPWYPGANIQAWLRGRSTPSAPKADTAKTEIAKTEEGSRLQIPDDPAAQKKAEDAKKLKQAEDFLTQQNKVADKQLANRIEGITKAPYSTAMMTPAPESKKPEAAPLAIPNPTVAANPIVMPPPTTTKEASATQTNVPAGVKRDTWGNTLTTPIVPPGKSLLDPAPFARPNDPLMAPERLMTGAEPKMRATVLAPVPHVDGGPSPSSPYQAPPREGQPVNWPLGTQSVQAAHSGLVGQPMYIPVPTVTVPQPQRPPGPPAPQGLDAPNLNAYVNAFTPPPVPKGASQPMPMQGMMPPQQQMMMQQQMLAQQQMAYQQQLMMQYGYRPNPAMMNPYMPQQPVMAQGMSSQGPMTNGTRQYAGPQAPNPFSPPMQTGYAPAPYPPMMPQQPAMQPVGYQQSALPTQQQSVSQQVAQLIRVLRENPYPAQREWAAQSLTSFEWRANPQIVPALIQSASQDPAASVRAGCVYCLGRMNAAVEPVFGTLHSMRNDIDPRVRTEVEQTLTRLGQTPMAPGN